MGSREASAGWCVFDSANVLQAKPDALMAEINTSIAAIEYARASALLSLSPSSSPSSSKSKSPGGNTASMYDASIFEEAYRMGCVAMAEGVFEVTSMELLTISSIMCSVGMTLFITMFCYIY